MPFNEMYSIHEYDMLFLEVFSECFRNVINGILQSCEHYKLKLNQCQIQLYEEKKHILLNLLNNPSLLNSLETNELRRNLVRNFFKFCEYMIFDYYTRVIQKRKCTPSFLIGPISIFEPSDLYPARFFVNFLELSSHLLKRKHF
jgi:hypothetical protein